MASISGSCSARPNSAWSTLKIALSFPEPDQSALTGLITAMTEFINFWRAVGLYAYQTHYDCVLAKLLTAAGRLDEAQERVATALQISADTGMHFHDAELLRARAHTHSRRGFPNSGLRCGNGVGA